MISGGGGDVAFDGEMTEECFDFSFSHFAGMTFVMKDDVALNPLKIAFFGAVGLMFAPNGIAHYF